MPRRPSPRARVYVSGTENLQRTAPSSAGGAGRAVRTSAPRNLPPGGSARHSGSSFSSDVRLSRSRPPRRGRVSRRCSLFSNCAGLTLFTRARGAQRSSGEYESALIGQACCLPLVQLDVSESWSRCPNVRQRRSARLLRQTPVDQPLGATSRSCSSVAGARRRLWLSAGLRLASSVTCWPRARSAPTSQIPAGD